MKSIRQHMDAKKHAQIICRNCNTQGHVTAKPVKVKRGGRKQKATEMSCSNCGTKWHVD